MSYLSICRDVPSARYDACGALLTQSFVLTEVTLHVYIRGYGKLSGLLLLLCYINVICDPPTVQ